MRVYQTFPSSPWATRALSLDGGSRSPAHFPMLALRGSGASGGDDDGAAAVHLRRARGTGPGSEACGLVCGGAHVRGEGGIGRLFASIFRGMLPLGKKLLRVGARAARSELGREAVRTVSQSAKKAALRAGISVVSDGLRGKNIVQSVKKHAKRAGSELKSELGEAVQNKAVQLLSPPPPTPPAAKKKKKKKSSAPAAPAPAAGPPEPPGGRRRRGARQQQANSAPLRKGRYLRTRRSIFD